MSKRDTCPKCLNDYQELGRHWTTSHSCSEPSLSKKQEDIITGCLMGDGNISCPYKTPYFRITNIQKEYLKYLDKKLSPFSSGVSEGRKAEDFAEYSKSRDGWSSDSSDYNDAYVLRTKTLNQLKNLYSWYSSGEKVFPESLELTPTILKHWYVCDGWYSIPSKSKRGRIHIRVDNESKNKEKLNNFFKDALGISVDYWRGKEENGKCVIVFFVEKSERLFNYMGEPLPGFEYKWPGGDE